MKIRCFRQKMAIWGHLNTKIEQILNFTYSKVLQSASNVLEMSYKLALPIFRVFFPWIFAFRRPFFSRALASKFTAHAGLRPARAPAVALYFHKIAAIFMPF